MRHSASRSVSRSPSASPSASSDARLKQNVEPITHALEMLAQIRGVSFQWKDTGMADMGVLAQEVEKVCVELVTEDEMTFKRVNYNGLVGLLFAAVQELHAEVRELKQEKESLALAAGV